MTGTLLRRLVAGVVAAILLAAPEAASANETKKPVDPEDRLTQAVEQHLRDVPQITFGQNPFVVLYVLYKTTDPAALELYERMQRMSGLAEYRWVAFGEEGLARRGAAWMAYEPTQKAIELLLRGEAEPPRINEHPELRKAIASVRADVHNTVAPALKEITGKGLSSPLILYRDNEGVTYLFRGVPNRATLRDMADKADW